MVNYILGQRLHILKHNAHDEVNYENSEFIRPKPWIWEYYGLVIKTVFHYIKHADNKMYTLNIIKWSMCFIECVHMYVISWRFIK